MKRLLAPILIATCLCSFQSCDDDQQPSGTEPSIKTRNHATLGEVLTDKNDRTLYFFSKDAKGASACTAGCLATWPIFFEASVTVPGGLNKGDFSTIERTDGKMQTTYKGFPLYYFNQDSQPGEAKGEKVNNVWFVAKRDYSLFYQQGQLVGHDGKSYIANYTLATYAEGEGETAFITDAGGRTLYTFKNDKNGVNTYAGNAAVWPVFYTDLTTLVVPSILNKEEFTEITKDGIRQLAYRGWPLYYFGGNSAAMPPIGGDTDRGDTRGVSFPLPGIWPIANTLTNDAPDQ